MRAPVRWLAGFIAALTLAALIVKVFAFRGLVAARGGGWGATLWLVTGYFTLLTHAFGAMALGALAAGRWPRRVASPSSALGCLALSMVLSGVVYHLLLSSLWRPVGLHWWADQAVHGALPALTLVFWFAFVPKAGLRPREGLRWLAYPVVYFIYVMVRGAIGGGYPYPFLDVAKLGYVQVFIHAGVIGLGLALAGPLMIFLARGRT